jgi:Ca2+-dependent lipid-binding protein
MFSGGSIDPYVRVLWDGKEVGRTEHKVRSQRPRFDHHVKVNFQGEEVGLDEDDELRPWSDAATLRLEVWDWDRFGKDDFISFVEIDGLAFREKCCLPSTRPEKFPLRPNEKVSKAKKAKYGVGALTLQ